MSFFGSNKGSAIFPPPGIGDLNPVNPVNVRNYLFRGGKPPRPGRHSPEPGIPVPTGEVVEHDFEDGTDEPNGLQPNDSKGDAETPKVNGIEKEKEPEIPVVPGVCLEVKRVDEVYDRKKSEWKFKDSIVTKKKKASDPYIQYAFTVNRKFLPTSDPTLHVIVTTIDIKSPYLKKAGTEVIKQVQGISWTSKPLRIDPQHLIAFLPQLQDYVDALRLKGDKTEEEDLIVSHVDFLIDFLRTDHAATLEELNSLITHDEITFDLLWAILVPRTILYAPCPVTGEPRAVRLTHAELCSRGQGSTYWRLEVEYVEWNSAVGPSFGLASLPNLEIPSFKGAAKIASLAVYPIKWYPGVEELQTRLIERGRKWVALAGVHHMHYNATGFHFKEGKHVKLNTNSRIMVDWKTFAQTMPNYELPTVVRTIDGEDVDRHMRVNPLAKTAGPPQLSDADLMLTSPIVYGFSLADKLWLEFNVDYVLPFTWNDAAFENLVLPRDQKTLIESLVEAHGGGLANFDDFVEGKGKGLVINLFGNPGVGKSLTAEATSEHVRKPLYVIGAGDLGTSAALLDVNLTRIFNISSNWGAVVLIDEADVFLEERSFHNIERNAMVAVFLRQLEYFRGILFLTTNRVKTFDEAFQSRIHVALRYQDLTGDAKRQIWVAFLKKAHTCDKLRAMTNAGLRKDELHELGEKKVNGRQIKNVVRTAAVLATSRQEELGYKHLIQVLDMMEQFDSSNAMYQ